MIGVSVVVGVVAVVVVVDLASSTWLEKFKRILFEIFTQLCLLVVVQSCFLVAVELCFLVVVQWKEQLRDLLAISK